MIERRKRREGGKEGKGSGRERFLSSVRQYERLDE